MFRPSCPNSRNYFTQKVLRVPGLGSLTEVQDALTLAATLRCVTLGTLLRKGFMLYLVRAQRQRTLCFVGLEAVLERPVPSCTYLVVIVGTERLFVPALLIS